MASIGIGKQALQKATQAVSELKAKVQTAAAPAAAQSGGYSQKYTGGNAALDNAIKGYSDKYFEAKAAGDAAGMREANDAANQLRNQYGYAAEFAHEDIAKTAAQSRNHGSGGGNGGSGGGLQAPDRIQLSGPTDYSQYIEEMNRAKREAALSALKAAYEKNLASLDRAEERIGPLYEQARNQTAGASEQQKRQFAEYAAARGLNSGTAGQAELARGNTLQRNLGELNTAQADAQADLELQRRQVQSDYNNAIAQAEATGNYELAQQLYAEKVRVDEGLRQMQLQQAQLDMQNWQVGYQVGRDQISDRRYTESQAYDRAQDQYQRDASRAAVLAGLGDYSGYSALWGLTQEQTGRLVEQYARDRQTSEAQAGRDLAAWYAQYGDFSKLAQQGVDISYLQAMQREELARRSGSASGGSKRGGSSSGGAKSGGSSSGAAQSKQDYEGLFQAAQASGRPKSFIANNYKKYGFTASSGLYDDYGDWEGEKATGLPALKSYQEAASYLQQNGKSAAGLMTQSEWVRHKNSGHAVGRYESYQAYLNASVRALMQGG